MYNLIRIQEYSITLIHMFKFRKNIFIYAQIQISDVQRKKSKTADCHKTAVL